MTRGKVQQEDWYERRKQQSTSTFHQLLRREKAAAATKYLLESWVNVNFTDFGYRENHKKMRFMRTLVRAGAADG
jgi:hypothetical protein